MRKSKADQRRYEDGEWAGKIDKASDGAALFWKLVHIDLDISARWDVANQDGAKPGLKGEYRFAKKKGYAFHFDTPEPAGDNHPNIRNGYQDSAE